MGSMASDKSDWVEGMEAIYLKRTSYSTEGGSNFTHALLVSYSINKVADACIHYIYMQHGGTFANRFLPMFSRAVLQLLSYHLFNFIFLHP